MSNKSLYKKKINLSTKTQLKQSVVRKLLKQLRELYPTVTEEQWGELFPSKCNVFQKKLTNKSLLYCIKEKDSEEEGPDLFLSPTSKQGEAVFPTLTVLWKYPDFAPAYYIDTHICKFVFRGADLFLAGIDQSLSEWENVEVGTPRALKVVDNPYPIGVGYCMRSSEEIRKFGFREKGMKILHFYTDQLWELNGAKRPDETFDEKEKMVHPLGYVPPGMQPAKDSKKKMVLWPSLVKMRAKGPNCSKIKGVYRRRAKARSADRPVYDNVEDGLDAVLWHHGDEKQWMVTEKKDFGTDDCWAKCASDAADPTKIEGTWYLWSTTDNEHIVGGVRCREEVVDDWEDEVASSDEEVEEVVEDAGEEEIVITFEEEEEEFVAAKFTPSDTSEPSMEDQIVTAFTKACFKVDDFALPMQSSDFYQQMKDLDDNIDVKQSKFKKLGKFLDFMKNEKRIKTKKKKGKIVVEFINREHSDYKEVFGKGRAQERLDASGLSQKQFDLLLDIVANPDKFPVKEKKKEENKDDKEEEEEPTSPEEQRLIDQINQYLYGEKSYCGKFIYTEDVIQVLFGGFEALQKCEMDGRKALLSNEEKLDTSFVETFKNMVSEDDVVMEAFLTVLKTGLEDSELPLPDVNLLDLLRNVNDVDFPGTSWGSLSKFLARMEKKHFFKRGRTPEQAIANPDIYYITSVRRDHPKIEEFEVQEAKEQTGATDDPFSDPKFDKAKVVLGGVTVVQMWKPSGRLNPIFELNNPGHSHNVLYTVGEVRRKLWDWCRSHDMLLDGRENECKATNQLWRYILKPKKDKQKTLPQNAPAFYPRKTVLDAFMHWCTKHCAIKTKGIRKPRFVSGDLTKILVYVEKRQGGHRQKHVTFVWNLESYGVDLDEFRKAARRKFAASSTITDLPGKGRKGSMLVKIQGDRAESMEIHDLLVDEETFNIPNKFVEITNKRPM